MLRSALSAFTRVFDALWRCAADPGPMMRAAQECGSRLCGAALHAAPRPGHEPPSRRHRFSLFHFSNSRELTRPHSRGATRPSCAAISAPRQQRAQGKPGARRTHSPACELKKHTSVVTTGSPETPGLPCAMVLTVSFALSPVTGLSCHRSPVKVAFHRLDASVGASGPRDFAVRVSAARLRRYPRPLHPAPNVRDDAYAPLIEAGCGES